MKSIGISRAMKGLLPLAICLAFWQVAIRDPISQFPPPVAWIQGIGVLAVNGSLWPALLATLSTLIMSLAVATLGGFGLGIFIGTIPVLRQWTGPLLEYGRALPPPVMIPVVVLMLGYSITMEIVVVGLSALWPILLNTIAGVAQIRGLTFDVARSFHMSRIETLRKIVVPATIPFLLTGLRIALPHAIIISLVLEMFTGAVGLGSLMIVAQRNYDAGQVFGLLVLVGILGLALTTVFNTVERVIIRAWPTQRI